ncbi:MAG: hypothetical protein KatS3mg102_1599 [Planctomycetota bacterium]|nr:MAG: hypothetical protein KatS3mg102_1599 [Planctomycetota bacterium]
MASGSAYRPQLRAELKLWIPEDPERDGPPRLGDPLTGNQLVLRARWQLNVLELCDGSRDLEALWRALPEPERPAALRELVRFVKSLRYLRLTTDADADSLRRLGGARAHPEAMLGAPLVALDEQARFGCQGCGACCRVYNNYGPLTARDVQRLQALEDLEQRLPHLRGRPRYVMRRHGEGPASEEPYLPQRPDGRCAYLLPDNRCAIHAYWGEEHKPLLCRLYPSRVRLTVFGKLVVDRPECHSFGVSAFTGPTTLERLRRLEREIDELLVEEGLYHPPVDLDGGLVIDYAYFLGFLLHLQRVLEHPGGTVVDALRAVRDATFDLIDRLESADDAAVQPHEVITAACAVPPAQRYGEPYPPIEAARGLEALADWLQHQARAAERVVGASGQSPHQRHAETIEHLRLAALRCRLATPGRPRQLELWLPELAARLRQLERLPLPLEDPTTDRRLRRLARDLIFAAELRRAPSWLHVLAQLAGILTAIAVGARAEAARAGRAAVTRRELDLAQGSTRGAARRLRALPRRRWPTVRAVVEHLSLPEPAGAPAG